MKIPIELGASARVQSIPKSPLGLVNRCHALGFYPGVVVRIAQIAPLGCPLVVEVEGTHQVCMRRDELAAFEFEEAQ